NGLPIHGLLAASPYWELVGTDADFNSARLLAKLDFGAHPELLEGFPFPHELRMEVTLQGLTLTIRTAIAAHRDAPVPVAFGYHHAQVYAPEDDDVICFEPMTAAANALVTGGDLELVEPGRTRSATFSVTVEPE